jgi:hypothetical protein
MGKRCANSRPVGELAGGGQGAVPARAARSDGRNDDSVLRSRHLCVISDRLMRGGCFNEPGIPQATQPDHWKSTAAHRLPLAVHRSAVNSDGNQGGPGHDQRAVVDPALAEADHRPA